MTDHPIAPAPELVQEWREEASHRQYSISETEDHLIEQAAQYGADQELEACLCEVSFRNSSALADLVRSKRRPPTSLKHQALALINKIQTSRETWLVEELDVVRKALEQIDD